MKLPNQSALSQALGHSLTTIDRYLTLLERLFLIRLLPAWHGNRSKRPVKTPKLQFVDSGPAATLGELEPGTWNAERARLGHLLESFVLHQLIAMADCMARLPHFYHDRDRDKIEIGSGRKIRGVAIKAAASVNRDDARGLLKPAGTLAMFSKRASIFTTVKPRSRSSGTRRSRLRLPRAEDAGAALKDAAPAERVREGKELGRRRSRLEREIDAGKRE
jgi:predicted AAA+ superfamily ATPase